MREDITKTAGIDTGKKKLALGFWPRGDRFVADNSPQGIARLAGHLKQSAVTRVGIESTSIYHLAAADALRAEGFEVAVLQPGKVKAFAKLQGARVKTDASDAELVAGTAAVQERVHGPQAADIAPLAEHLTYIEQCEENAARLKTQRERFANAGLIAKKTKEIALARLAIGQEIKALEKAVRLNPHLGKRLDLAVSIPGVGLRTALATVIRMPELGSLGRAKAAALLGVAPLNDDTGEHEGVRFIQGGRARARKALFLSAFAASIHHNEQLKAFYKRLVAKGLSHTQAVIACARKLVILIEAIFKRGTPWQKREGMQCPH